VVYGAAALVFVVLFAVPFINVNRYRITVAKSLTAALGREVTVESISLQTFPQPGLVLHRLVVSDDPVISAEPMLRSDEVLATLHVSSLWRGRLEISSLKLSYPSLNLVRANNGRWNLESLLERARQAPSAPTAKSRPETRTRFPYIEATGGRINLKLGQEKKVYALGEADFGLWLASEDEWRMRLEARPIRTDANLSDTGTFKMEGSWHRAGQLRETPLSLRLWWDDGQLGQLTTLAYGQDRGLRGAVRASASVTGRPDDLKISADARIENFRRYDIGMSDSVSLNTHCDAKYRLSDRSVRDLYCQSPMGRGVVLTKGSFSIGAEKPTLDVAVEIENVPVQFLTQAARGMKKNIPDDINTTGSISGSFAVHTDEAGERIWSGDGVTSEIQFQAGVLSEPVKLDSIQWRLAGAHTPQPTTAALKPNALAKKTRTRKPDFEIPSDRTVLTWEPVHLAMNGSTPATMNGWVSRNGFTLALNGEAELARMLEMGRLIGLPTTAVELNGLARGRLQLAGEWEGFKLPDFVADAQLSSVTAKISGVSSPLRFQNGTFMANEYFGIAKAVGEFARVHSSLEFSIFWPKHCTLEKPGAASCGVKFEVNADQLNVDEINALINPKAQSRPWYAAIADTVTRSKRQSLPEIHATGKISAAKLVLKGITAARFVSNLEIDPGEFRLSNISAELLGGKYSGDVVANTRGNSPVYSSKGTFQNVTFANVALLMRDSWASGKLNASYEGSATGWTAGEITASAAGTSSFEWRDGVLHHIDLDSTGKPLQFRMFTGSMELKNGVVSIRESKLLAPNSIYLVSGTASLGRELELKLARDGAPGFSVSGTLERPKVSPLKVPETQATLR
jgi:hypothetical protein